MLTDCPQKIVLVRFLDALNVKVKLVGRSTVPDHVAVLVSTQDAGIGSSVELERHFAAPATRLAHHFFDFVRPPTVGSS